MAAFTLEDGDLTTAVEDYFDWTLVITDPNDTNANGVPDLTDVGAPGSVSAGTFTAIRLASGNVIVEWEGSGARLQVTRELGGTWTDLPGVVSPKQFPLAAGPQFYRLIRP